MNKKDLQKLDSVHSVKMNEVRNLSKQSFYALGFRHGFNVARRKIRKVLLEKITKEV